MSDEQNRPKDEPRVEEETSAPPSSGPTPEKPPAHQKPGTKSPDFATSNTLAQDGKSLANNVRKNLDPKRLAANAAMTAAGVKPIADALKVGVDTAKSAGESVDGDTLEPSRHQTPKAPEQKDAPDKSTNDTADGQKSSGSGSSAKASTGGGLAALASGSDKAGGIANALGAKTGLATGANKMGGGSAVSKYAKLAEKGGGSNGSATGDAKSIANAAKLGAKVGGPMGAAIAGGVQALRTKWGKRLIIASPFIPIIAMVCIVGLFMMIISPASFQGQDAASDDTSLVASEIDGMDPKVTAIIRESADDSGVPWQILAAIVKVKGQSVSADETAPMSEDEVKQAIKDNTPVGPYQLRLGDLEKDVHFNDEGPISDAQEKKTPTVSMTGYESHLDLFAHLTDLESATDLYAELLTDEINILPGDLDTLSLGAGVEIIEEPDSDLTGRGYGETPPDDADHKMSERTIEAKDAVADYVSTWEGPEEAQYLKANYVAGLVATPIDDIDDDAEEIYTLAMMWYFGKNSSCATSNATAIASGAWTAPVLAPITSDFGPRVAPLPGASTFHDGVDLGAKYGTPVLSVGAGTVVYAGEASGFGPNYVKVDHGNGVVFSYGHMSKMTVQVGDVVEPGTKVGEVGAESSGQIPGMAAHLHLRLHVNDEPTDPDAFLKERGVILGTTPAGQVEGTPIGAANSGGEGVEGAGVSAAINGQLTVAQANIPTRSGMDAYRSTMTSILATRPSLISLNEMAGRTMPQVLSGAPGYSGARDPSIPNEAGSVQALDTAVLWKTSEWTKVDSGRLKFVNDDKVIYNGEIKIWDRYANWVMLKRNSDGAIVSVISAHHMTNPAKYGPDKPARQTKYGEGMNSLVGLIDSLDTHGPVFMAGDMNTHASQTDGWAAAPKMKAAGYSWANEGIDFVFAPSGVTLAGKKTGATPEPDHKWVSATWSMNGTGAGTGTASANLPPSQGLPESFTFVSSSDGAKIPLNKAKLEYAAAISQKATELGMSDDAAIIALMVVAQESTFTNHANANVPDSLNYPHDDVTNTSFNGSSVGLFQQINSWGSAKDRLTPSWAAEQFLSALGKHQGWEAMTKGDAAQAVQRSGYPDAYDQWEKSATELLALVKGTSVSGPSECTDAGSAISGSPYSFNLATFNTLGCSHTGPGTEHPSLASCQTRFPKAMTYLNGKQITVAGLQEFQGGSFDVLRNQYGATWDVYPKDRNKAENALIWQKATWQFVKGETFTIPYFHNQPKSMPLVELKNVQTGESAYFINVHTPADVDGMQNESLRQQGDRIVKDLVVKLKSEGHPVYVTGDFNDSPRQGDSAVAANYPFCLLTAPDVGMKSAFGEGTKNPCKEPKGAWIDHIFGLGQMTFTGTTTDKSVQAAGITDHPAVYTTVNFGDPTSGNAGDFASAIQFAVSQKGKPYVWGAEGPNSYDCSGLVLASFRKIGITLPHSSRMQATYGVEVQRSAIQPGDLVFYGNPVHHVGIYVGKINGVDTMINAPHTGAFVRYDGIDRFGESTSHIRRLSVPAKGLDE
jgi:murein DD-endopeptidase MepM/ murein hydrolase activator NlpD/endonuclease/exonuclease/phosphatase (EEP) superfamily protein YafD